MQYKSPLHAHAFRQTENDPEPVEGRRVTVRPLAGAATGTVLNHRYTQEQTDRSMTPKSERQGPSQRKLRRWNNDNFVGIVSEIAKASSRGPKVAEVLLKAQADAPTYRSIYNPEDQPVPSSHEFMHDEKFEMLRHQFFQGEIGAPSSTDRNRKQPTQKEFLSPKDMVTRIDSRLLNVVTRACVNSPVLVDTWERVLLSYIKGKPRHALMDTESLLEAPTITKKRTGERVVRFYFDTTLGQGGLSIESYGSWTENLIEHTKHDKHTVPHTLEGFVMWLLVAYVSFKWNLLAPGRH
mmetsp:Transcript_6184/g.13902  ORF Transcript_6184/g.13902 Transcript_6184/m.13902 type:complete len:295 (+) Transcript_6184:165-1049(+)